MKLNKFKTGRGIKFKISEIKCVIKTPKYMKNMRPMPQR